MMAAIITQFARFYDPVRIGLGDVGLGMAATRGQWMPLHRGAHLLKRGTTEAAIDQVVGATGPRSSVVTEFPFMGHTPSQQYYYQVVPINPGGVEAVVPVRSSTGVRSGIDGQAVSPVPPPPRDLAAAAIAGGRLRITWSAQADPKRVDVRQFAIYGDAGTGTIDYASPLATVSAGRLPRNYAWVSDAFAHGTAVKIAVRSRTLAGVEETNTTYATATADALGPSGTTVTSVELLADE
jgi:hypothetical protein